jgi:hypothetical protein
MLLYPKSTLQLCSSRRFCEDFKEVYFGFLSAIRRTWQYRLDAYQSATSVRTMRSFRLDAHQCLEASNSSILHPSGRNGKSSRRSSEFEKILVFQCIRPDAIQCLTSIRVSDSRHSYGKTTATVRKMSSIRQVKKNRFPDNCPDAR